MVAGKRYEMYVPAAEHGVKLLGLVWKDAVGYSFEYAGALVGAKGVSVCTFDISYDKAVLGEREWQGCEIIKDRIGGATPLCPAHIAGKFIRPVTGE
jgi:hypothetical protein